MFSKLVFLVIALQGASHLALAQTPNSAQKPVAPTSANSEPRAAQGLERKRQRQEAFEKRLAQMTPEARERAELRLLQRIDSNQRRERMQAAMAYFRSLPPEEQQRLRTKFQAEKRQRLEQRIAKREQTRTVLQSLSASQRQVLREKMMPLDAKARAAFRDQLLQMQPLDRERVLGK
jgi:D-alanyl-D-alanine carboxypeptidase